MESRPSRVRPMSGVVETVGELGGSDVNARGSGTEE